MPRKPTKKKSVMSKPRRDLKEQNPKDAIGVRKVPISTVSMPVMLEVGIGMLEGAINYRRHNYRVAPVRATVYIDACFRHISLWVEGENLDPKTKTSHLAKAIGCLMIIRDAQIRGTLIDDRPPGTIGFVDYLNRITAQLLDAHAGAPLKLPYTHRDKKRARYKP